jgi:YbgC/YbaW family acyl-CoA thioester hydrolase
MRLVRRASIHYLDELEIDTWISAMSRVRADRNYRVRRVSDNRVVALATANWVYLDSPTLLPSRMPPEILSLFVNRFPAAVKPFSQRAWLRPPARALQGVTNRRAQYFEADSGRHTNNAIYVDWFEESVRDTLSAAGYPPPLESPLRLVFCRHSLEYLAAARPGDMLEISTLLTGMGRSTGQWSLEIRRAGGGEPVARDECTSIWVGEDGYPVRWP